MRFTARSTQKELLPSGKHLVTIASIVPEKAKANDLYKDQTPQLAVKFETEKGFITNWYNLKGYVKNPDGTYKIDPKKKTRIEDKDKTADAVGIFEKLAIHAGIASGEEFGIEDLVGLEVGIMVKPKESGQLTVAYSMSPDRVEAAAIEASSEEETEA